MSEDLRPRTPVPRGTSLEDELAKPRSSWTADDVVGLVQARGIQIVSLMHVGGDGWLKTLDFVPRSAAQLMDIIEGGERADGSNLFPRAGIPPDQSDIVLRPRIRTAFIDPFASLPTLVLLRKRVPADDYPSLMVDVEVEDLSGDIEAARLKLDGLLEREVAACE